MHKQKDLISWKNEELPLVVIAENIHSPANIGMIIRLCESFGVSKLYFAGPHTNAHTSKFKKASRSAEHYLDHEFIEDITSLIQRLVIQHYKIIGLEICDSSQSLSSYHFNHSKKTAIIIGSERHGISEPTLKLIEETIHIELYGKTDSINVSTALSIMLYEFRKQHEVLPMNVGNPIN